MGNQVTRTKKTAAGVKDTKDNTVQKKGKNNNEMSRSSSGADIQNSSSHTQFQSIDKLAKVQIFSSLSYFFSLFLLFSRSLHTLAFFYV